jgi:CcmD family protein
MARKAMTYLFCAFTVVWVGVFAYLYRLVERSRRLEREVDALSKRSCSAAPDAPQPTPRSGIGR